MEFDQKLDLALAELQASRIWKSSYYPPFVRVLHALGMKVRLPHYNRFWTNVILSGSLFGICWGLAMHLTGGVALIQAFLPPVAPVTLLLILSLPTGLLFGIAMATYYKATGSWNGLRSWEELGER